MEQIVINFSVDSSQLKTTLDLLVKTGQVTEADAKSFLALGEASKKAGDAGQQSAKKISDETKKASSSIDDFSKKLTNVAGAIGLAFGISEVVAFGKESVKAFQDAEKAAVKLRTAVSVSGGLQKDFENLVRQSEELQKISIFSDDDIQNAQAIALQFGLTSDQVDELLPKVIDFASATNQDLNSALQGVLNGVNGAGKGLKQFGIILSEGATATENLARINEQLTQKYADQARIVGETAFGADQKHNNELNNQQEIIGQKLIPAYNKLKGFFIEFLGAAVDLFSSDKSFLNPANWFKAADSATAFNDRFKALIGNIKDSYKNTPTKDIKEDLSKLAKEYDKLTGNAKFNAQVTVTALTEIINTREKATVSEFKSATQLKSLTDAQLKAERELADAKTGVAARTAVQLIDREIEARKKLGKVTDDAAKKAEQDREKADSDRKARQEKGLSDALKIDLAGIEAEKQRELARLELSEGGLSTAEKLQIDLKYLDLKQKLFKGNAVEEASIEAEKEGIKTKIVEQSIKDKNEASNDFSKQEKARQDDSVKNTEKTEAEKRAAIKQTLEAVQSFSSQGFEILNTITANNLQRLEEEKTATLAKDDAEIESLKKKFEEGHLGRRKYDAQIKALEEKRAADQKKIDAEIAEQKRKQAIITKAQALFDIAINTSRAIVATVGQTGFFGLPLAIIVGALGAAQAAVVAATPLPKFHKGRLAQGNSNEELAVIRKDETIFNPQQSKEFAPTFHAIYNGKIKPSLLNEYVNFKLKGFGNNQTTTIDYNKLAYAVAWELRDHKAVSINNTGELAAEIAKHIPQPDPRKW